MEGALPAFSMPEHHHSGDVAAQPRVPGHLIRGVALVAGIAAIDEVGRSVDDKFVEVGSKL